VAEPEVALPQIPEAWVWLARIRRPQGRKGEVFADILTDFPEKFAERRLLWLVPGDPGPSSLGTGKTKPDPGEARQVELTNHWLHKGGIVLHFAGFDSISAAEGLASLYVAIPRAERATLAAHESYISDLIGCTLVDVSEAKPIAIGPVTGVDRTAGAAPLLVVQSSTSEILIPFAKSYLRRIDLDARRVEMALPEGLVNLNAPDKI